MNQPLRFMLLSTALTVSMASILAEMQQPSDTSDLRLNSAAESMSGVVDLTAAMSEISQPMGELASITRRIAGTEPFEIPYTDTFGSDINGYTVYDSNNDGVTWEWRNTGSGYACYQQSATNAGDDWLITPDLNLKGGHAYKVSVEAGAGIYNYDELLEVKWGKGKTSGAMTNDLIGPTVVVYDFKILEDEFTPEADGSYNIGLHAISNANNGRLLINVLKIEEVATETSPGPVTNLKGVPYPDGSLKATISFTAPVEALNGSELSSLDYIEVRRNDVLVHTIDDAVPGQDYSWIDNNAFAGSNNEYKVKAFKDGFPGEVAELKLFVGIDLPTAPVLNALDQVGSVKLSWLPVSGVNGGVVPEESLKYDVWNYLSGGNTELITEMTNEYEYTIEDIDTDEGDTQSFKSWLVRAVNPVGYNASMASVIMGKPYTTPYSLSFKNATLDGQFVSQEHTAITNYWWGQTSYDCQDGDNGSMSLTCYTVSDGHFATGKIALDPNIKSKLSFYYKAEFSLPGVIYVTVKHRDGTVDGPLFEKDLADNDNDEWHRVVVDMPALKNADDWVSVAFHADMTGIPQGNLYFDNISIFNDANDDATITLKTPESIVLGQDAEIVAELMNVGINDIEDAKIQVFVNDEPVGETSLTESLATLHTVQLPVIYHTNTVKASENYIVRAVVIYDKDENIANNQTSVTITAAKADVDPVKNLEVSESNPVELTWDAPAYEIEKVTDDFESYDAWSTKFGGWKTVDNDGGYAGSLNASLIYPHQYEQFAFMTWRPSDYFYSNQGLEPHSGVIGLVSIYQQDYEHRGNVESDNWLISPLLSGNKQTISIWVNNKPSSYRSGKETFDILSSTTGKDLESFTVIDSHLKSTAGWEEITFEVPEGTRFFALHHTTEAGKANVFMIDDITYEGSSAPESYNVYRDYELIASVFEPGFSDTVSDPNATYRYDVTAVYNGGYESEPICTIKSELIEILEQQNKTFDVYTIGGVQILKDATTLHGLNPGIYIINGEKVYLHR